jgi:hypothetical protein
MRRAVRRMLASDSRFQEVHAGLWETIGWDYDVLALREAEFRVLDLEVTGSDPENNASSTSVSSGCVAMTPSCCCRRS